MMQSRRICLVVSVVCLLAPAAQAGDKTPNYYPLQVGNEWHYQADSGGKKESIVTKITKKDKVDGIEMAVLEGMAGGKVVATEHLVQSDKGVFRHRFNNQPSDPPFPLLRYPVKAGDKWMGKVQFAGADATYTAVAAEEDNVEVPAGKYKTVRVRVDLAEGDNKITTTYWWADGIGFVKQTIESGPISITLRLEKMVKAK